MLEAISPVHLLGQQRLQMARLQAAAMSRAASQLQRAADLTPARFENARPSEHTIKTAQLEQTRAERRVQDVERQLNLLA